MSPIVYRMKRPLGACGTACTCGHQSRPLSWLMDAPQRSPAPEPRSRDPGLATLGLPRRPCGRAWAALAYGKWHAAQFTGGLEQLVRRNRSFTPTSLGLSSRWPVTLVGFFRPRLQNCATKHDSSAAGKALPAIPLGIAARVGTVGTPRLAVPCLLVRSEPTDTRENRRTDAACSNGLTSSWQTTKPWSAIGGFPSDAPRSRDARYGRPRSRHFTARRAALPAYQGGDASPSAARLSAPSTHLQGAHHCRDATGPLGKPGSSVSATSLSAARGVWTTGMLARDGAARFPSGPVASRQLVGAPCRCVGGADKRAADGLASPPLIRRQGSPPRRKVDGSADDIALHPCCVELSEGKPPIADQGFVVCQLLVSPLEQARRTSVSRVSVGSLRTRRQGTARRGVPTVPTRAAMPSGMAGNAFPAADESCFVAQFLEPWAEEADEVTGHRTIAPILVGVNDLFLLDELLPSLQ